ncbi:MAG: DsbE family thiol:disulfide interchange protein [Chromatiales bacterium]|nr:DsbE family thiol:disulfide interchange protein [Chromatiales bacterium]
MKLRFLWPLLIFAALAGLLYAGLHIDPRHVPSPLIGKPVPEFDLPSLNDASRRVTSADLRKEITLVNIWASWCSQCRVEHDMLLALARNGVPIIGLNWKDEHADATRWIRSLGDPYRMTAFDADGRVGIDWGVYGAPETFVVDANGMIRYKHIGALTPEVWRDTLEPLIAKIRAGA